MHTQLLVAIDKYMNENSIVIPTHISHSQTIQGTAAKLQLSFRGVDKMSGILYKYNRHYNHSQVSVKTSSELFQCQLS